MNGIEMSENTQSAQNDSMNPAFQIQRIYLKDISLEQPNAPQIFLTPGEPNLEIQVDIQYAQLQNELFEVIVIGTITTRVESKVLFLVEAQQAGIFELKNIPAEQIEPMLSIACPTILYPYLRSNIADLIGRAGFQPVHLAEINFHQLYEDRLKENADNTSGIVLPN
jgi:preprotein translocase subunit SecB